MPRQPPPGQGETKLPSAAWGDFRAYLTGQRNTGRDLPDRQLSILQSYRRLPVVVASDLWPRKNN